MTEVLKFLPGTGRGTMRSIVEELRSPVRFSASPSTSLRLVSLPILGGHGS
jgi:hypothetical protein